MKYKEAIPLSPFPCLTVRVHTEVNATNKPSSDHAANSGSTAAPQAMAVEGIRNPGKSSISRRITAEVKAGNCA